MIGAGGTNGQRRHPIRVAAFVFGALLAVGRVVDVGQRFAGARLPSDVTSPHRDHQLVNRASRYVHPFARDLLADWRRWTVGERITACLLAVLFLTAGPIGVVVAAVGASM
jgi:hypothetical protein